MKPIAPNLTLSGTMQKVPSGAALDAHQNKVRSREIPFGAAAHPKLRKVSAMLPAPALYRAMSNRAMLNRVRSLQNTALGGASDAAMRFGKRKIPGYFMAAAPLLIGGTYLAGQHALDRQSQGLGPRLPIGGERSLPMDPVSPDTSSIAKSLAKNPFRAGVDVSPYTGAGPRGYGIPKVSTRIPVLSQMYAKSMRKHLNRMQSARKSQLKGILGLLGLGTVGTAAWMSRQNHAETV